MLVKEKQMQLLVNSYLSNLELAITSDSWTSDANQNNSIAENKVSCCVTDNEPTNNCAARFMPFEWMGCFDHLVQLLTECFTIHSIGAQKILVKVRRIVTHFNESCQATEKLLAIQSCEKPTEIPVKVKTRWWSTLNTIERLIRLKPFIHYMIHNKNLWII
jgi:hypothetical protein